MRTIRLRVIEAARRLFEIIGWVRFKGDGPLLLKSGRPVAELGAMDAVVPVRLEERPAILEASPHLKAEDAERFARDLESGRMLVGAMPAAPQDS